MAATPVVEEDVLPDRVVVSLRLDRSLVLSREAAVESERAALPASFGFGVSLLRNRVLRERAEARAIAVRVAEQTALVEVRERHVADLRRLLSSQDQLIGALQGRLREVAAQAPTGASTPSPAFEDIASPVATAALEPTPEPTVARPNPAPVVVAGGLLSSNRLWPPGPDLLMPAGALLLVAMLLGWMLVLRSRKSNERLDRHAQPGGIETVPTDDALLRETLRQRARKTRIAPELTSAANDPLEMPAVAAVASVPAGPGPLSVVSGRGSADPQLLKEVDTLIAFENYDEAAAILREQIDRQPKNPEYRLRLLHVESAMGNVEASAVEEEILASIMMDGPLSATINRVLCAGRDMLPGHPLFEAEQWRAAEGGDTPSIDRTLRLVPPAR